MSVDIYAPCPCGSGKKFKFCCSAISEEMDRIGRLIEGNQPRVGLQQLEALEKKVPNNPWVGTTRAMVLLDLNDPAGARDVLKQLLNAQPDNELAIALFAAAMVRMEGLSAGKRAVHRAFQKSAKKFPGLVSDLANAMAIDYAQRGQMMAAREHLALALRLTPEERRQELFVQLLELDGENGLSYPMRGSHLLPNIPGLDLEVQKEVRKAQKYAAVGCWSTAADVFTTLANDNSSRPEFWHSAGLCRAWDGDEKVAAEALHRAARQYEDLAVAVECETLAQLLDELTTQDVIEECVYQGEVGSVSRLLTELDKHPSIERVKPPTNPEGRTPAAAYVVLDTDQVPDDFSNISLEQIPHILAKVVVDDLDEKRNSPATIVIAGIRGSTIDRAKSIISAAAGDLLTWSTTSGEPEVVGRTPKEFHFLDNNWYLPKKTPLVQRQKLFNRFWDTVITEKWPQLPLRALEGHTPEQAAKDPAYKVALLGAVYALDAAGQVRGRGGLLSAAIKRLNIEPLPAIEVTPETNVGSLSVMQMHRLPIDKLSDQQLLTVVNRSMLIRHDETLYQVLKAAVARPNLTDHLDMPRIMRTLAELSSIFGQRDEAFEWIDQGRKLRVEDGKTAFQQAWTWDLAELASRLEDPTDPKLQQLLHRFVTYYGPKVPQIRPHIEQTLEAFDIPSPWSSIEILSGSGAAGSAGIWTSDQNETSQAGGKLWLPGQ
ncbi:SEC-C metal-binding domain-containing protein [Schlesneria sp. DSM 10557]|uniref:SEC-C metal-binding domain-containing protein n=1 Tax=Schlesneria sp. DSM 10557 TaxID=3044399 RepID=UPI00359FEA45